MATMTPIAVKLVPDLLRARGVAAGLKELTAALALGTIPGTRDRGRWLLSEADLDAAERYFRERAARGVQKGGAAALARAGGDRARRAYSPGLNPSSSPPLSVGQRTRVDAGPRAGG